MCSNNPKDYRGFWKRLQRQNRRYTTIEFHQFDDCFFLKKCATYGPKRWYETQNYSKRNTYRYI